ncbi:L,D-transpeptidase family protein [Microvirga lenta]|uniref:L,D-transpeptidase family protein n=1 Tax=Microvirga lenta TaxID=2881337 RepID=UPI001CFD9473|nr:murein L,D-transpeptidase family protein [Microvirga lenta]MCB5174329.1 murein L,D-transpeptidase [Microvirga lenta]
MRRLTTTATVIALAAAIGLALLRPDLLSSASDRAIRIVGLFSDPLAHRLRHGTEKPLPDRLNEKGFRLGTQAFIRIFKEEKELEVWLLRDRAFALFASYPICAWSGTLGPKLAEGDRQSPEGFYAVGLDQLNPRSAYYRAFNLGFPNAYDRAHGRTGSFLMVHGDCLSIGCYAMTDKGIDDIYRVVEAALRGGQSEIPVHVFPFRMTDARLAAKADHPWASFWANLKEGYDLFETTGVPPSVSVCSGRYAFGPAEDMACQPIRAW